MEAISESFQGNGESKIGILMVALGPDNSAAILSRLGPDEVRKIIRLIASTENIGAEQAEAVLDEFRSAYESEQSAGGGAAYAEQLLNRALGPDQAQKVLSQLNSGTGLSEAPGMPYLSSLTPEQITPLVADQHPQMLSTVLAHIPPEKAAAVLENLPNAVQMDVARRMVVSRPPGKIVVAELDRAMRENVSIEQSETARRGPQILADVLSVADRKAERAILGSLDQSLADQVRKGMFVFEDLPKLHERDLQSVLHTASAQDLALALKGAGTELQELVFKNISERAADAVKEDMELLDRAKQRDIEAAQQRLCGIVRKMIKAGKISLGEETDA